MARRIKSDGKAVKYTHGRLVSHGSNAVQHGENILFRIVWDLVFPVLHDLQAVIQQDSCQVCSHGGHIDSGVRIGFADNGERPYVIHVRVADKDRIQTALRLDGGKVGNGIL